MSLQSARAKPMKVIVVNCSMCMSVKGLVQCPTSFPRNDKVLHMRPEITARVYQKGEGCSTTQVEALVNSQGHVNRVVNN